MSFNKTKIPPLHAEKLTDPSPNIAQKNTQTHTICEGSEEREQLWMPPVERKIYLLYTNKEQDSTIRYIIT